MADALSIVIPALLSGALIAWYLRSAGVRAVVAGFEARLAAVERSLRCLSTPQRTIALAPEDERSVAGRIEVRATSKPKGAMVGVEPTSPRQYAGSSQARSLPRNRGALSVELHRHGCLLFGASKFCPPSTKTLDLVTARGDELFACPLRRKVSFCLQRRQVLCI